MDQSGEDKMSEMSDTSKRDRNPADMVQYQWNCTFKNLDTRQILEKELPDLYNYKVDRFKLVEKKDSPHESKFEAEFIVDICSQEERDEFISQLEEKNGTNFNKVRADRTGKSGDKFKTLKCARNVRVRLSDRQGGGGKGSGSGRVEGVERQPGKNQNCNTTINTKLKPCDKDHNNPDIGKCFNLEIELNYDHTHEVESTNSFNFLEVEQTAKLRLLELFESGLTPSRAKKAFEEELKLQYGNKWLEISSKRSINPDRNYVFRLHTSYWSNKFGTINGPEAFIKAKEFIDDYNKKAGDTVATIKQLDNGGVVVCVVDHFMRRVHSVVPQSGQIMFVDATGSLDRCNHQLLKMMTESPVGGLPLGFIILSEQTEKSLSAGVEEMKKLLPAEAFAGRAVKGPEIIMTDDDKGLVNALRRAWPAAVQLQCQWHILQANWRWLCSNDNGVRKQHRQCLLKLFKNMMYAKTRDEYQKCEDIFLSDNLSNLYQNFQAHIKRLYSHRIETWALYSRLERQLPTRGSNTNNYCEASMKTTKETQFGRVRTFNLPELLQVICDDSAIYVTKLIDIGNGRDSLLRYSKSKYLGKDSNILEDQIVDLGDDAFLVESETVKGRWYMCNMVSGFCSCPVGVTCAPCKHKAAVTKHTGKAQFSQTPKNDPCQRALYHYIAWGRTLEPHMYRNINDPVSVPDIAAYIEETLQKSNKTLNESLYNEDPAIVDAGPARCLDDDDDNDDSEENDEYNAEIVRQRLVNALDAYKEKVLHLHQENTQDDNMNKAMMAFTKTLNKSLRCTPTTIQKQMHEFGKSTVATNRTKHGGKISVNPPAISRRTFKVPGRGPAPQGRPPKQSLARTQLVVEEDEEYFAKSDTQTKQSKKKLHNFAGSVNINETLPKRHTKQ